MTLLATEIDERHRVLTLSDEELISGPYLPGVLVIFLFISLLSSSVYLHDNAKSRRNLAVVAGFNKEKRKLSRQFVYTVLLLGVITIIATYITGMTASLGASHFARGIRWSELSQVPGVTATIVTVTVYALAVALLVRFVIQDERVGLAELLADIRDARKHGALENSRHIAHFHELILEARKIHGANQARRGISSHFDRLFTSQETEDRRGLREQQRHLRQAPEHSARRRHLIRRMFRDVHPDTGFWGMLLCCLMTLIAIVYTVLEVVSLNAAEPGTNAALIGGFAALVGVAACVLQYLNMKASVLLLSRREFIANQTEAECRLILEQAEASLDEWAPQIKIGRWEAGWRRVSGAYQLHPKNDQKG